MERIFKVEGMKCNKCTERIERVMNSMDEIKYVECNLDEKTVVVDSDMNEEEIKELIEDMGFDVV